MFSVSVTVRNHELYVLLFSYISTEYILTVSYYHDILYPIILKSIRTALSINDRNKVILKNSSNGWRSQGETKKV